MAAIKKLSTDQDQPNADSDRGIESNVIKSLSTGQNQVEKNVNSSVASLIDIFAKHLEQRLSTPFLIYYIPSFTYHNFDILLTAYYRSKTLADLILITEKKLMFLLPAVWALAVSIVVPAMAVLYSYIEAALSHFTYIAVTTKNKATKVKDDLSKLNKERETFDAEQKYYEIRLKNQDKIEAKLNEISIEKLKLEGQVTHLEKVNKNLEGELNTSQSESSKKIVELDRLRREFDNQKKINESLEKDLNTSQANSSSHIVENDRLRREIEFKDTQIKDLKFKQSELKDADSIVTSLIDILKTGISKDADLTDIEASKFISKVEEILGQDKPADDDEMDRYWFDRKFAIRANELRLKHQVTQAKALDWACEEWKKELKVLPKSFQANPGLLWSLWRSKGWI